MKQNFKLHPLYFYFSRHFIIMAYKHKKNIGIFQNNLTATGKQREQSGAYLEGGPHGRGPPKAVKGVTKFHLATPPPQTSPWSFGGAK